MKIGLRFSVFAGLLMFLLASCHLEDFNLNKLADPDDLAPVMSAPLAYGTFKIKDFESLPIVDAKSLSGGMWLTPIPLSKEGTTFLSSAIDTLYMVSLCSNYTKADLKYEFKFVDSQSSQQLGRTFASGVIHPGVQKQKDIFTLNPTDQIALNSASRILLIFNIAAPSTSPTLTYGQVKTDTFSVNVQFYAPVRLTKL